MTPQELFDARDRGEEIEFESGEGRWVKWNGTSWCKDVEFRIVKPEPKLVPHWPAILSGVPTCGLILSNTLYSECPSHAIRLATEYPPIYLPEQ